MDELIKRAVDKFLELNEDKPIRVVTHNDTDGITSGSIMCKALIRAGRKFVISYVKQLDEETLKEISKEKYETILFTDLGSGYLKLIKKFLVNKCVFIFDHHEIEDGGGDNTKEIIHVNPKLINEENYSFASGAGVVYLFCKSLNKENVDLSYLALIGAIGDIQDLQEGVNKIILDDAVSNNKIEVKRGLKMFGYQSRAIHKILEYSDDPYIPGISGNENGAINFLNEIGIKVLDENGKYRKMNSLNDEEMQKLVAGIIIKRFSEDKPEDVLGDLYLLKDEDENSLIKDAREFSTVLNCCGRLDSFSTGIGLCFGNKKIREEAEELLKSYRLEIIKGLNYFYENKDSFVTNDNFMIVNAKDKIRDTLIGTLIGIVSRHNEFRGKILIGMVYRDDDIKISVRCDNNLDVDLREILMNIIGDEGIVGGHKMACGGLISKDKEEMFMSKALEVLSSLKLAS
ncbi:hypothetical protein CL617_00260 [archaeon]|nr:hypothetical protein [archaeon]|tara:strand:- start:5942 stop:7315 length:1374 start_codon:yes stop_codon:yes gene_type:complete